MKPSCKVLPTNNRHGDLAIVAGSATKPIDRIATIRARDGIPFRRHAALMAVGGDAVEILRRIKDQELLDLREQGTTGVAADINALLEGLDGAQ